MKKHGSMAGSYFRSFFLLILFPVILIAVIGGTFVYRQLMEDAHEKVQRQQETVSAALKEEIRQASFQLAHFMLVDDRKVLGYLEEIPESPEEYNQIEAELENMFTYYRQLVPSMNALHLYMKDGSSYELYANLAVPRSEIEEQTWYQMALETDGRVSIGAAAPDVLLPAKVSADGMLLTAVLHFDEEPGEKNNLEAACLYFETDVNRIVREYNEDSDACQMVILLDDRPIAGNLKLAETASGFLSDEQYRDERYDWCRSSGIHNTRLRVVTLVDNSRLLQSYTSVLFICLGVIALIFLLYGIFSVWFLRKILRPIDRLSRGMKQIGTGDFSLRLQPEGHLEMQQLMRNYNDTCGQMQQLIEDNRKQEEEKYREQMKALQNEINPHFLLNTVNTIRFMAELAKFDSIRDMAADLMSILSCILRKRSETYTLDDEVKLLESYVRIMEIRYSGGFEFESRMENDCHGCRLPKLLLQPLVENALLHGLEDEEDGRITLTARTEQGKLIITVADNGRGIPPEKLRELLTVQQKTKSGASIGVSNVRRRIELQYGSPYGLSAVSTVGVGTEMTVTIPAEHVRKEGSECSEQ